MDLDWNDGHMDLIGGMDLEDSGFGLYQGLSTIKSEHHDFYAVPDYNNSFGSRFNHHYQEQHQQQPPPPVTFSFDHHHRSTSAGSLLYGSSGGHDDIIPPLEHFALPPELMNVKQEPTQHDDDDDQELAPGLGFSRSQLLRVSLPNNVRLNASPLPFAPSSPPGPSLPQAPPTILQTLSDLIQLHIHPQPPTEVRTRTPSEMRFVLFSPFLHISI
jgi:hypothetical protein